MTQKPVMAGVVEGILAELEQVQEWMVELQADLVRSGERRARLAQALDAAVAALDPPDRAAYDRRVLALLGDPAVQAGRPPADARYGTVLDLLAGWSSDSVTTTDVRLELERRGLSCGKNYGANLLKSLARRGVVLRTGHGRYRITRMHPQLVTRRNKLWQGMQGRDGQLRPPSG